MPIKQTSFDPTGIADGLAPGVQYTQAKNDQETATSIMALFTVAQEARLAKEREWELNRTYLKGEQLQWRDRVSGEIVKVSVHDGKRLYSINNQLRPVARSLTGKLARMMPTFSTVPASSDSLEVHGSRVADVYLQFFRRKENLDVVYLDGQESVVWAGTGVYQLFWDKCAGQELAWCPDCNFTMKPEFEGTPCPRCEEILQQADLAQEEAKVMEAEARAQLPEQADVDTDPKMAPKLQIVYEGDYRVVCHDIRDVFPEPGVRDPKDLRWLCIRKATPVSEIRKRFPEMALMIEPESGLTTDHTSGLLYSSIDQVGDLTYLNDYAYLYEYHERPTALYPAGRVVFICNGKVLSEEASPYAALQRLPFFFQWWMRNPGELWGESFIAQAWHRQKELNSLETQLREHVELMTHQKVLVPLTSKIATDEITATTGQIIKYNPTGGKPDFINAPPLSSDVYNRRALLMEDIRLQAGITASDQGQAGSDPNGRAMAIIQAESEQQIGPVLRRNIGEWKDLHRGLLLLSLETYSPEKQISIAGDEGNETYALSEMNLMPGWDLQLEVEDGLSYNQAIRLQQALDLLNAGALGNVQMDSNVLKRFAKLAKIKIPGVGLDTSSGEYAAALEIPRRLERGEPVQPTPVDDALVFAEVLTGWLRSHRHNAPPELWQQVAQIWQYYVSWAQTGAPGAQGLPPVQPETGRPSQPGQDMTAPGGSANSPGHTPEDEGTGVAQDAQQVVQQADRTAEGQARVQQQHEG